MVTIFFILVLFILLKDLEKMLTKALIIFCRPFGDKEIFPFENRRYCEHDYKMLFAPQCARCGDFAFGEVISALNRDWHPECFTCEAEGCGINVKDGNFVWHGNRLLCTKCYSEERSKKEGKPICQQCFLVIEAKPLRFRGDP